MHTDNNSLSNAVRAVLGNRLTAEDEAALKEFDERRRRDNMDVGKAVRAVLGDDLTAEDEAFLAELETSGDEGGDSPADYDDSPNPELIYVIREAIDGHRSYCELTNEQRSLLVESSKYESVMYPCIEYIASLGCHQLLSDYFVLVQHMLELYRVQGGEQ